MIIFISMEMRLGAPAASGICIRYDDALLPCHTRMVVVWKWPIMEYDNTFTVPH